LFIKKKATLLDYIPRKEHLIEARSAATNMIGCAETTCMQISIKADSIPNHKLLALTRHPIKSSNCSVSLSEVFAI